MASYTVNRSGNGKIASANLLPVTAHLTPRLWIALRGCVACGHYPGMFTWCTSRSLHDETTVDSLYEDGGHRRDARCKDMPLQGNR